MSTKFKDFKDQVLGRDWFYKGSVTRFIGASISGNAVVLGVKNGGVKKVDLEDLDLFLQDLQEQTERAECATPNTAVVNTPNNANRMLTNRNSLDMLKQENVEVQILNKLSSKMLDLLDGELQDADLNRADMLCKMSATMVNQQMAKIKLVETLNRL